MKGLFLVALILTEIGCSVPEQQADPTRIPDAVSEEVAMSEEIQILLERTAKYRMASDVFPSSSVPTGDAVIGLDSFSVGLVDSGRDGLFTFEGGDRLLVGDYGEAALNLAPGGGAVALDETRFFRTGRGAYEVVAVDPAGASVKVRSAPASDLRQSLRAGAQMPKAAFATLGGKHRRLSEFVGQTEYLFLDIWATYCPGCHEDVELIRALRNNPRVTVLSLNYNESVEEAKAFVDRYRIDWPNGLSNEAINEALEVEAMPRGVLIDQRGKVIRPYIRPHGVMEELGIQQ